MSVVTKTSGRTISGRCSLFVCRCCRTKYGWQHQPWCDKAALTRPACADCRYYRMRDRACIHPAKKYERGDDAE